MTNLIINYFKKQIKPTAINYMTDHTTKYGTCAVK